MEIQYGLIMYVKFKMFMHVKFSMWNACHNFWE